MVTGTTPHKEFQVGDVVILSEEGVDVEGRILHFSSYTDALVEWFDGEPASHVYVPNLRRPRQSLSTQESHHQFHLDNGGVCPWTPETCK
mgnify:CR=1 FL=1